MVVRVLTALVGLAVWVWGVVGFAGGEELTGGLAILAGGLLIVVAAQGGWGEFWDGLVNFLYWR